MTENGEIALSNPSSSGGYESEHVQPDSVFKQSFKFYKNSPESLALSQTLDFDDIPTNLVENELMIYPVEVSDDDFERTTFDQARLTWPPSNWRTFNVKNKPGFLFVRNPFVTPDGHQYWAEKCLNHYILPPHITNVQQPEEDRRKFLRKLRWSTMGYHHDWNTKIYDDSRRSAVPDELAQMSGLVATAIGDRSFNVEAVIVNFYRMNSTLAGHVDHSERILRPLLSFSFGQSAIFLLGGRTLDERPLAIRIRSGDVVVMDAECRLAYHAVPRILVDKNLALCPSNDKEEAIADYLRSNRININVRQVN